MEPASIKPAATMSLGEADARSARSGRRAPAKLASRRSLRSILARVRNQAQRYLAALWWVAGDALPRCRSAVLAIVVCNIAALACMALAIGGVMLYARHAQQHQPLRLFGREFLRDAGVPGLLQFAIVIAGLGLISAACTYLSDRLILRLAHRYHALCADRAIAIAADPAARGWQIMADEPPRSILTRLTGSGSRAMGMVLRDMLRIIAPLLTAIAALGFLLWIDRGLTAMLLPVAVVYLIPLYLINRRVARFQIAYRTLSPRARSEVGRRLREMLRTGELEHGAAALRADGLGGETQRGALEALYSRLLADRRIHLLNAGFFIACLIALFVLFGVQAHREGRPWSDLIFYLVALRFAITSLKQATALIAKFSRFFPEFRRYAMFVDLATRAAAQHTQTPAEPLPETISIRLGRETQWDSPRVLRLNLPVTLLIVTPEAPGHADLEALALRLDARIDPPAALALRASFAAHPLRLMKEMQDAATPACFLSMAALRGEQSIDAVARRNPTFLAIAGDDPQSLRRCAEHFPPRTTFAIILDGFRIIGGGDGAWLQAHEKEVARRMQEIQATTRGTSAMETDAVLDDDSDDEDDA